MQDIIPLNFVGSTPFLTVDGESVSLSEALQYLKQAGGFQRALGEILRQYIIDKELQTRDEIQVDDFRVDQALLDFRNQSQLNDPELLQKWLVANGISYTEFRNQIALGIKGEKLKNEVTHDKLKSYFEQEKPLLDQVVLSRIILEDAEKAEEIGQQIRQDPTQFESLAREHSITNDKARNGLMGVVRKGTLPEILRTEIAQAEAGAVVGPLAIDNRYCLFRVEEILPATLDEPLKQELKNQLFEKWIQERLKEKKIKLEVK
jgi:PPIC-type PPIASE domain